MSLLELLIALALLALIAGGLASSMGLGIRLYERTDASATRTDAVALRIRLRALLSTAEPPRPTLPFSAAFAGQEQGLSFVTLAASQMFSDAAALRVSVASAGGELQLTLETLNDSGTVTETFSRTLASGLSGTSFEYYDTAKDEDIWLASWTDTTRLPALVRITAAPGSDPDWPEFTVRLRLAD